MTKREFGELELAILRLVRELKVASVQEVVSKLGDKVRYTTVMTVMTRLANKGELTREKEGKKYLYSISKHQAAKAQNVLQRVKEKVFGGKKLAMVSYLLQQDEDLSEEEILEMEQLLHEMRKRNG